MKTFYSLNAASLMLGMTLAAQTAAPPKPPVAKNAPATNIGSAAQGNIQTKSGAVTPVMDVKSIKAPKLHEFKPQMPKRIVLQNGIIVFLQEDHELPLIDGFARIRGGGREALAAKAGMMSIYGDAWRTGGTHNRSGDELDDYLEARAAKVETGGGLDSTSINFSSLKGDFDDVFGAFLDVLRNPEFRQDKVDLAKQQISTAISRRNEDVEEVANREANKLGYGADSPYARVPEMWTVAAVTRNDLVQWHQKYVTPANIIVGISGDFDSTAMEAKLRAAFADWQPGNKARAAQVPVVPSKPGVWFASKEDVDQSQIQMVSAGIRRDDPDFFAVRVLNEVMSGGFASRLVKNIRTLKGLAYSVDGGVDSGWDHPGLFRLDMGTKSKSTVDAIDALKEEMEKLIKHPPSDAEVKQAKDQILNSFIFRFDSKDKILEEEMLYEFYGFPLDYLTQYRANIEKITTADVNRVVQRLVHPDSFAILVVGNAKEFGRPLTALGQVNNIDITIPTEDPATRSAPVPAPTESDAEGKALIFKVAAALGGKQKLSNVKGYSVEANLTIKTPQGDMNADATYNYKMPESISTHLALPGADLVMVYSPETAYRTVNGELQELPEEMRKAGTRDLRHDMLWIAQEADNPKFIFSARGTEKVNGKDAAILVIMDGEIETHWFIDQETGLILRAVFQATGMSGPVTRQQDFTDYHEVDGIKYAFNRTTRENGQVTNSAEIKKVTFNPEIDPKAFKKP